MTPPITTPRLTLEPVAPELAAEVLRGELSSLRPGEGWPHEDTADALRMAVTEARPPLWFVLFEGSVIGDCGVHGPVDADGSVEIGYGLAAPYRGRGYGTEVVVSLSRWLLTEPGVQRVYARGVLHDNVASQRALERAGFTLAGRDAEALEYVLEGHRP